MGLAITLPQFGNRNTSPWWDRVHSQIPRMLPHASSSGKGICLLFAMEPVQPCPVGTACGCSPLRRKDDIPKETWVWPHWLHVWKTEPGAGPKGSGHKTLPSPLGSSQSNGILPTCNSLNKTLHLCPQEAHYSSRRKACGQSEFVEETGTITTLWWVF